MTADLRQALQEAAQALRLIGATELAATLDRLWQARLWAEKRAACR